MAHSLLIYALNQAAQQLFHTIPPQISIPKHKNLRLSSTQTTRRYVDTLLHPHLHQFQISNLVLIAKASNECSVKNSKTHPHPPQSSCEWKERVQKILV